MTLNQMPDLVLEEIFVYLSFEYLCSLRRVSVRFYSVCKGMLNSGFKSSQKNVAKCLTEMKIMRNFVADEMKERIEKRIEILVSPFETDTFSILLTFDNNTYFVV